MKKREGLVFYRRRKKLNMDIVKEILIWILEIIVVLVFAFFISVLFFNKVVVIGDSMLPNFENGQMVLTNRLEYVISKPEVDDIVVFRPMGNEKVHYYIKRVVGVPGDALQIIKGELYRNGEVVDEVFDKIEEPGCLENIVYLGDDEYFVLGDNRNSSEDSRVTTVGFVSKDYILGKVWFSYGTQTSGARFVK